MPYRVCRRIGCVISGTRVLLAGRASTQQLTNMSGRKKIFISYGREAGVKEFVEKLHGDLSRAGLSVWLDTADIGVGSNWPQEIGIALNHCRALIAVMTKKYVRESDYCEKELYSAVKNKKRIYPVIYGDVSEWRDSDDDAGAGVLYMIEGINWAMFRPGVDNYPQSLKKLIEALKEVTETSGEDFVDSMTIESKL